MIFIPDTIFNSLFTRNICILAPQSVHTHTQTHKHTRPRAHAVMENVSSKTIAGKCADFKYPLHGNDEKNETIVFSASLCPFPP